MMPLGRQPVPERWWHDKQEQLFVRLRAGDKVPDVLRWLQDGRTLAHWFHELVREPTQPRLCAYCDGKLGETARETIDHFIPVHAVPWLALSWENLYPACDFCNEKAKGQRWSCDLIRPDIDLQGESAWAAFSRWFVFDPETGRLQARRREPRETRRRVRLTIAVLQLNRPGLRQARIQRWRSLIHASKAADQEWIREYAAHGPYRFVAEQFLASLSTAQISPPQGPAG